MSEGFATFILMNNYFHDVATAMLLACGIVLRVMLKQLGSASGDQPAGYAGALFRGVTAVFWSSVAWIVASGAVRVLTFRSFEWHNAQEKHFETGLFVKYGIAVVLMAAGAVLWRRVAAEMRSRLRR